jgi:uncharacterized protein
MPKSVINSARILSLDVVRGFAVLGILLVNIIGFGSVSAVMFNPALSFSAPSDVWAWAIVELTAEGAMRAIFSMLFGAGVLLFLDRGAGRGRLHFKRTFWLLVFGFCNVYILMWLGDILVTYALAGFVLYFFRNIRRKNLLVIALAMLTFLCVYAEMIYFGLEYTRQIAGQASTSLSQAQAELTAQWAEFHSMFAPGEAEISAELAQRRGSFFSVLSWTSAEYASILMEFIPMLLFWDALVFMTIGMVLYRYGLLQGNYSNQLYFFMAVIGLGFGFSINAYEIRQVLHSEFDILHTFSFFKFTYHLGRLAMAIGWIGLLILLLRRFGVGRRLAAVGRMALTNYLMQSLICLFVFTGIGLGLVGTLSRSELYLIVLLVWVFQLWLSPWWLARYHYGPAEWFWRYLTYGRAPQFALKSG